MARTSVRQLWKAKLEGSLAPAAWPVAPTLTRSAFHGRVLGIDPSLRGTGLALLEFSPGRAPVMLRCQTVKVPAKHSMAQCLGEIHRAVALFVADFDPMHVALEQTIYVQNFQTAQILGAARGAAISAAALREKEIFEYFLICTLSNELSPSFLKIEKREPLWYLINMSKVIEFAIICCIST
ncbi:MAG: hypothetical protein EBT98_09330, partial [Opitutaceae bacterium]|nr:hypothetical protein [Opitutaceae bacterium]